MPCNKCLQYGTKLTNLHLLLFFCDGYSVMAFVFIHRTHEAQELPIGAAVKLLKFVMTTADAFFDPRRSFY